MKMNKIHHTLLVALALMLGGCTYEQPAIEQTTPDAAYRYAYRVMQQHLRQRINSIQTILAAEQWASFDSQFERYEFENAHFPSDKLQDMGGYIQLIDFNGKARCITRDSLAISEIGATRTLEHFTLRTIGENLYEAEFTTPDDTPYADSHYRGEVVEKVRWVVRYKHDFSANTELLSIVEGAGTYAAQALTLDYSVDNVMCEVKHKVGSSISIFNGQLRIKASSLIMEAEGTPPDLFTINYSASDNHDLKY